MADDDWGVQYWGIDEVAQGLDAGDFSSRQLTQHMLERIAKSDPRLNSYVTVTAESASRSADASDQRRRRGETRGPLDGIPLALKDNVDTADAPTRVGMPVLGDRRPAEDATVVTRLKRAGSVLLGKLQLTEGAYAEYVTPFRPPVNPWSADRWPGASSSGNGVALAAGLTFGAIGSDTGGSIRLPSAANGITGVKPTWGRVSRAGVFELAATLDHIGPMARSARGAALLLAEIAGADPRDPTAVHAPVPDYPGLLSGDLREVTIGLDEAWAFGGVDPEVVAGILKAVDALIERGATLRPVSFPDAQVMVDDWFGVCAAQTALVHEAWYPERADLYSPALRDLLDLGHSMSALDYQRLILRRADFRGQVESIFDDVDLLVTPAMAFTAPPNERMARMDDEMISGVHRYTCTFTMTGNPTVTIPVGLSSDGLPVAMQLVGRHFDEALLLRAADAFQRSTDWHRLTPPGM